MGKGKGKATIKDMPNELLRKFLSKSDLNRKVNNQYYGRFKAIMITKRERPDGFDIGKQVRDTYKQLDKTFDPNKSFKAQQNYDEKKLYYTIHGKWPGRE